MQRTLKPCFMPGCAALTRNKYCEQHQDRQRKENAIRSKYYDRYKRDQQAKSFYNSKAWRQLRVVALTRDYYECCKCGDYADVVDHIVEIKDDWSSRLRLENLQSLCHRCHNKKTAKKEKERKKV